MCDMWGLLRQFEKSREDKESQAMEEARRPYILQCRYNGYIITGAENK